ncbi:MAG TPA: hypothetical protein VE593_02330 [Nitrososphaeraceae archaeon]|nr:hypothetical protein [Nitrososphaeraceae archaeon]
MSDYNPTNTETSSKDKDEDKKEIIPGETSNKGSKKPVKDKKVVVVKPGESDVKISHNTEQSEGA